MSYSNDTSLSGMPNDWVGKKIDDALTFKGVFIPVYPFNIILRKYDDTYQNNLRVPQLKGNKTSDVLCREILDAYSFNSEMRDALSEHDVRPLFIIGDDIKGPFKLISVKFTFKDVTEINVYGLHPENGWMPDFKHIRRGLIVSKLISNGIRLITVKYQPFKADINEWVNIRYPIPVDTRLDFRDADLVNECLLTLLDELMNRSTAAIGWMEPKPRRVFPTLRNSKIVFIVRECDAFLNLWDLAI